MKLLAVIALFVAVAQADLLLPNPVAVPAAVAGSEQASEIQEILAAINHPSTDAATAAALEEMLLDILGVSKPEIEVGPAIVDAYEPISVGPAIVDSYEPISVGPAIVDSYEPISVGPAIVDSYEPISVGPAIVDSYEPISVGPAIVDSYEPISVGPALVDFTPEVASPSSPLVQIIINVNTQAESSPAIIPTPVLVEEVAAGDSIVPTPVIVVENIEPTPVIVVEGQPEPVVVGSPILPTPVITLPEILN